MHPFVSFKLDSPGLQYEVKKKKTQKKFNVSYEAQYNWLLLM
jgi:hypothetical protein